MSQAEEISARPSAKPIPAPVLGMETGSKSLPGTQSVSSPPHLPLAPPRLIELSPQNLYDKCTALARNLWWSWHPEVTNMFRELDPIRWRQLDHNPIALLSEFNADRLELRVAELVLYSRINHAYRRLREYLTSRQTWADTHAGVLGSKPVAYFSAEFGMHESIPIYSGGLGVLSGDHVKSCSDLGIPFIAIGLFFYFILLRPQQAEQRRRKELLTLLKKNDKVVTTGGMIGTIADISSDGTRVTLRVDDNTRIKFLRSAIQEPLKDTTESNGSSAT